MRKNEMEDITTDHTLIKQWNERHCWQKKDFVLIMQQLSGR